MYISNTLDKCICILNVTISLQVIQSRNVNCTHPSIHPYIHWCIPNLSIHHSIYLPIHPSLYLYIHSSLIPSIHPLSHLSKKTKKTICPFNNPSIHTSMDQEIFSWISMNIMLNVWTLSMDFMLQMDWLSMYQYSWTIILSMDNCRILQSENIHGQIIQILTFDLTY